MVEELTAAAPDAAPDQLPGDPPGRARLRQLYGYLKETKVDVPDDYQVFEDKLLDSPERQRQLYDHLRAEKVDVPETVEGFSAALSEGVKKKPTAGTAGSAPAGLPTAAPTPATDLPADAPLPPGDAEFKDAPAALRQTSLGEFLRTQGTPTRHDPAVQARIGQYEAFRAKHPGQPDNLLPVIDGETAPARSEPDPHDGRLRLTSDGNISVLHQGRVESPFDKYEDAGLPVPPFEQIRAQEEARRKAQAEVDDDGFWASFGKSLYNGLDPRRIGGNLLDYAGDALEMLGRSPVIPGGAGGGVPREVVLPSPTAPLRDDKATDKLAKDWLVAAERSDLPLSEAAQQSVLSHPSRAAAGNLLGSGAASIIPVALATAAGGPVAGAAVGGGLGVSASKDAARQAGVSDQEATITATLLAPIQAVLEEVGVSDPGVAKLAVRATLREALAAGGGKLTAAALAAASKKVLPELGRRAAAGAGHEALTEFLQGEVEGGSQLLADYLRGNDNAQPGQGRYGVTPMQALVTSPLEQALAGGLLGAGVGTTHGVHAAPPAAAPSPLQVGEQRYEYRRPTGQVELSNVRVVANEAQPGLVRVQGETADGTPVERVVSGEGLHPMAAGIPPAASQYATVSMDGRLGQLGPASQNRDLLITPDPADPTKATFSLNPTANQQALIAYKLPGLGAFFEDNGSATTPTGLTTRAQGRMELRDGQWVVTQKSRLFLEGGLPEASPAPTSATDNQEIPDDLQSERVVRPGLIPAISEQTAPPADELSASRADGLTSEPFSQRDTNAGGGATSLPEAQPHPDHVTPLTPQQQAQNDALDALDRYNALDASARKGKAGSAARAEIAQAGKKAGLDVKVGADYGVTVTKAGKHVTRASEHPNIAPARENEKERQARIDRQTEAHKTVLRSFEQENAEALGSIAHARHWDASSTHWSAASRLFKEAVEHLKNKVSIYLRDVKKIPSQSQPAPGSAEWIKLVEKSPLAGEWYLAEDRLAELQKEQAVIAERYNSTPEARQLHEAHFGKDGIEAQHKALRERVTYSEAGYDIAPDLASGQADGFLSPGSPIPFQPQPGLSTRQAAGSERLPLAGIAPAADPGSPPESDARADAPAPAGGAEVGGAEVAAPAAPEPAAEAPNANSETRKAEIRASIDAASQRIKERRAARKAEGKVFASPLGIGEIHPDDLRDALEIVKGHVQLGVLGVKNLLAKVREAGLDEEAAPDAALLPHLRELLTGEDAPALAATEPEGSEERRSTARLLADDARPEALKERVRDTGLDRYEPKSVAETSAAVDSYMARNSLADAYVEAISTADTLTGDVRTALRVRVLDAVGQQLTEALDRGDTASADAYLEQAEKVTEALAKRGTDAGREINAYKLLVAQTPEAAVYKAQKEVAAQREKQQGRLTKKAAREAKAVRTAKREALDNALATPAVRAAREKVAGRQPATTQERRAAIRAERDDLFAQLRSLSRKGGQAFVSLVPITPQQAQAAVIHVKIFRTYLQEGLTHISSLVERFRRDVGPAYAGYPDAELRKQAAAAKGDHDEAIRQGTAALGTTLDQLARDHLTDPAAVGKSLAEQFVQGAGLTPAEAAAYADAIEQEFGRRIAQARQARLAELNKRAQATPAKRASQSDLDKTRELFALSPTDDAAILDHLKRVNDLPELTAQDVAELRRLAGKVRDAPDGFQKDEAVEALLKRQQQIKGINWADIGQALWYANVLSGYKTHVINLTANIIQTASELGVNTTHAVLTGQGRYATASAKGLVAGLGRGIREARSVLTTGRETSRSPDKYEVPGILENVRFAGGAANPANYLKYVNRALRAGDVLFSTGLKEMRAYEQAVKFALEDAKSDGTPNQDVWARAAEKLYNTKGRIAAARAQAQAEGLTGNDLERRVYELAEQSRDAKLMDEAREYATAAVFNGEVKGALGWVATGTQYITNGIDIKGFKPAKFLVPFTRVITNVANAYLDYTPVGAARAVRGGYLGGGGVESKLQTQFTAEQRQRLAIKSVVGTAAALAAYALSNNEDKDGKPTFELTGGGTGDPTKDAQLRADGWQPYSIKVGDTWYSYANTPVAIMLAGVGSYNDQHKYGGQAADDQGAMEKFFLHGFRALQFTKDMTALKGTADFLSAIDSRNPTQIAGWAQRLAAGSAKGYVPWSAFLTQVAKDGEMLAGEPRKQGRSFGQMLYQDIPVARDRLNNALDALGDPIAVDTDRLFSAPPHRDAATQRIWDWLDKNNLFISVPNRNSGGALVLRAHQGKEVPMTDDEYYRFMQERGKTLKGLLQTGLPDLQKLDKEVAARVLKKYAAAANTIAKARVFGAGAVSADEQLQGPDED